MARFDDQFERHDPLAVQFGPGDTWQRKIALEARSALSPTGRAEVKRIAHFLDALISWRALRSTTVTGGSASPDREHDLESEQRRKQVARSVFSDVHLLEAGRGTVEALEQLAKLSDQITEADIFAVLALWKLVDYTDLRKPGFFSRKKHAPFMWWSGDTPLTGADLAGVIKARLLEETLAEAAYAAATAWRLREAALLKDGLQAAVDEANRARDLALEEQEREAKARDREAKERKQGQERRRKAAKAGAAGKWAPLPEHKAKAWELANSQAFRSRAAAARYAAAYIPKDEDGNEYTVDTVDGWLKDAGWKRTK